MDMVLIKVDGSPSPPSLEARLQSVEVERSDFGYSLNLSFTLPDYCTRFDSYNVRTFVRAIEVSLNISDVSAGGNIACAQVIQELSQRITIEEDLTLGETYAVSVNGRLTNSFSVPQDPNIEVITVASPIESAELLIPESFPPQYSLRVISALPKGSSCSWFNGYDIASPHPDRIEVEVTHHEVSDLRICAADYPVVETVIPLDFAFESGREYAIAVNGELVETFEAQ